MPVTPIHSDISCLWGHAATPMNLSLEFHTRCQVFQHRPCFEQGSGFAPNDPLLFQFHYSSSYQKVVCRVTVSHPRCSTDSTEACRNPLYCYLFQPQHSKRSMTYWPISSLFCQKTWCCTLGNTTLNVHECEYGFQITRILYLINSNH